LQTGTTSGVVEEDGKGRNHMAEETATASAATTARKKE